uniref:Uncharacterized protein n=1 Tax=Arundo donax TaxID=35708 RepID=A0A0A8YNW3_ARUDO
MLAMTINRDLELQLSAPHSRDHLPVLECRK